MDLKFLIPQMITTLRLIFAPILFYTINDDLTSYAIICFAIILITDAADGLVARKFKSISNFGGFYDAITDFVVILTGFSAFVIKDIYPFWLLIIFTFHFLFFIFTSKAKELVYDPVGKYYGAILIAIIGITLLFPNNTLYLILTILIVIITFFVLLSRIFILKAQLKSKN